MVLPAVKDKAQTDQPRPTVTLEHADDFMLFGRTNHDVRSAAIERDTQVHGR